MPSTQQTSVQSKYRHFVVICVCYMEFIILYRIVTVGAGSASMPIHCIPKMSLFVLFCYNSDIHDLVLFVLFIYLFIYLFKTQ